MDKTAPNIADALADDGPALLRWQAACDSCHWARVERILREKAERRRMIADGEIDAHAD